MGNIWDIRVVLFSVKLSAEHLSRHVVHICLKMSGQLYTKKEKFLALIQLGIFFPLCHSKEKLSAKEELMYEEFESHYKRGRG